MPDYISIPLPPDPMQEMTDRLQRELIGLFTVEETDSRAYGFRFAGTLTYDPDDAYDEIQRRFAQHGFIPTLQESNGKHILIALSNSRIRANAGNPLINIILLFLTICTTLIAGASMDGTLVWRELMAGAPFPPWQEVVKTGWPFAVTLLGILGVHEFGHYLAARWHGVVATLPYFIPIPSFIGTLGAFIALRSPMKNRRVLFDIGAAGPWAGFVVAVPLFIIGLWLSPVISKWGPPFTVTRLNFAGASPLITFLVNLFKDYNELNQTIDMHPIMFAAWIGLLVTGINLLPVGQLDGGHIAYALFGKRAHALAISVFVVVVLAGIFISRNWLVWGLFIVFGGLRHPPPLNDVGDIGRGRRIIGWLSIILFFLVVVPTPFGG